MSSQYWRPAAVLGALFMVGCSEAPPGEPPAPRVASMASPPASGATAVVLPSCADLDVQNVVRESFIRHALVAGDRALVERGALKLESFAERDISEAMPQMLDMTWLQNPQLVERNGDGVICAAQMQVSGWDLTKRVRYDLTPEHGGHVRVQVDPQFVGAEGFNMMIGYRGTFGRMIMDPTFVPEPLKAER